MKKQGPRAELKLGDHVRIPADDVVGTVTDVHPHEVTVKVTIDGETAHRKYAYESVERVGTLDEVSHYVDH